MSFNICSIGCGGMAVTGHGPAFRKYARLHPDTVLAACCDIDEHKAAFFQQEFGFRRYYTDMYEMLDHEKPDAVSLVVPVHLTAKLAVTVLERGIPLILEKPPGIDRDEALRIMEAAERSGAVNRVAFNRRYMPMTNACRGALTSFIREGSLQNINCEIYRIDRRDPDFSTTAIHGIDLVRLLASSDYEHIRFRYKELPGLGPGVANIFMDCRMQSGITAQLSFCPVAGRVMERYTVNAGSRLLQLRVPVAGSIDSFGKLIQIEGNRTVSERSGSELAESEEEFVTGGFYAENATFINEIRAGLKPSGDVRSALQSLEVAQCIRERLIEYTA